MTKPANKVLSLAVQYACDNDDAAPPSRPQLRRWVSAALDDHRVKSAEITVRFVDAEEGRTLNREYRGKEKDYATNVLTFPYAPSPQLAGDLVLCNPVVFSEAGSQDKLAANHFAHLVVHGMLHLQGYDHESEADARRMEAKEREILRRFGIRDPYEHDS